MSVQILSDGKIVFEFESEMELQTLINLVLHAKFSDGMRPEFTFSDTANRLVSAVSEHLAEKYSEDKNMSRFFQGKGPHQLDDDGLLRKRVEAVLEELGVQHGSEKWHLMIEEGLYPWRSNTTEKGIEEG